MNPSANQPPREGDRSPWGSIQQAEEYVEGIVRVHTAGRGGIWLSAERLAQMPADQISSDGWYEEDCEATFVLKQFMDEIYGTHEELDSYDRLKAAVDKDIRGFNNNFAKISIRRIPTYADEERMAAAKELSWEAVKNKPAAAEPEPAGMEAGP